MMLKWMMLVLFLALGITATGSRDYREEAQFLTSNGLQHLITKFFEEEISMIMMPQLTDEMLRELGITTIGARIRFRDAVRRRDEPVVEEGETGLLIVEDGQAGDEEGRQEVGQPVGQDIDLPEADLEEDEEGDQGETELIFYTTTGKRGSGIYHHFLDGFYRYDRNKLKRNGRGYFQCAVRGCVAR
jgi:hypothetical protein